MKLDPRFWSRKRVCVTGGTGFLGWHIVRQLLPLTRQVRILGLPPRSRALMRLLRDHDCVFGDVRDPETVGFALRGCDLVFHAAGPVAVWGRGLKEMQAIHVDGTREVVRALPAGARLVHTSSVVAIGAAEGEEILTESARFNLQRLGVDYVHAKRASEEIALEAAGRGADVVVVNPAYLLGPEDEENSVMCRFCLRYWRRHLPIVPPGGFNFVDVRDAAIGHLLAAQQGAAGARYILGGENRTMGELVAALAEARGLAQRRRLTLPAWLLGLVACLAEWRSALVCREPYPSRQHARLNQYRWYYSAERAHRELGFAARPLRDCLADMHEWCCATGRLKRPTATTQADDPRRREKAAQQPAA